MASVIQLICDRLWNRLSRRCGRVWPEASIPRMLDTWLVAMRIPLAVMNPAITGCDRKLARNPSRSTPSVSSIAPDSPASVRAAAA